MCRSAGLRPNKKWNDTRIVPNDCSQTKKQHMCCSAGLQSNKKTERPMCRFLQNGVLAVRFEFFVPFVVLCVPVFLVPFVTFTHFYPGQKLGKPNWGTRNCSTSLATPKFASTQTAKRQHAVRKWLYNSPVSRVLGFLGTSPKEVPKWVWAKPKVLTLPSQALTPQLFPCRLQKCLPVVGERTIDNSVQKTAKQLAKLRAGRNAQLHQVAPADRKCAE